MSGKHISSLQKLGLFVAGVCHDIDHRGRSNAFMITSNTPLGNLYTSSTMEWHHFHQAIFILEVIKIEDFSSSGEGGVD